MYYSLNPYLYWFNLWKTELLSEHSYVPFQMNMQLNQFKVKCD